MPFYVYFILCNDDSFYIGSARNVESRFDDHQKGINPRCYTYSRRPLKLIFKREFEFAIEAIAFENQVKRWSRAKKMALATGNIQELKRLAKSHQKKKEPPGSSEAESQFGESV